MILQPRILWTIANGHLVGAANHAILRAAPEPSQHPTRDNSKRSRKDACSRLALGLLSTSAAD